MYDFLNWKRNLHGRNDIVLTVETSKESKDKNKHRSKHNIGKEEEGDE